jgi:hypothetical protein
MRLSDIELFMKKEVVMPRNEKKCRIVAVLAILPIEQQSRMTLFGLISPAALPS